MPYSTESDLVVSAGSMENLAGLSDHDVDGAPDDSVISEAIARADGWIDLYVQRRHQTPLTPVPDAIRRMSADESVYLLKRAQDQLSQADIDEHAERRQILEQIAEGILALAVDPNPGKSTAVAGAVGTRTKTTTPDAVTRDGSRGLW